MSYKREPGESENKYIYRICSQKDSIGTWYDVRDILNAELGRDWNESAYRKKYQEGKAYLLANEHEIFDNETYLNKLREEREKLQRERYKLQTDKIEYNKWLREHARDEMFEEKVIDTIRSTIADSPFIPIDEIRCKRNERGAILSFADCHFAKVFKIYGLKGEIINEYSPEIFYNRMNQLLEETIAYIKKENITYLKVFNLGDSLEGLLRNSQIWSLSSGVVDSALEFANYISEWLAILSEYACVEYYAVNNANHTELRLLDGRKGEHANDNMEKIITAIIAIKNEDNPNFQLIENKTGFIFAEMLGFNIIGVHGEEKNLEQAIKDYSTIYDINIDYLFAAHKHHNHYENCGVRKGVIGIGSIMGSDDYSMKIKRSADATASIIIFEKEKGKTDEHIFILN